jgi:hypothetical protein
MVYSTGQSQSLLNEVPAEAFPPGTFGALISRLRSAVASATMIRGDIGRAHDAILGDYGAKASEKPMAPKVVLNGHIEEMDALLNDLVHEHESIAELAKNLRSKC